VVAAGNDELISKRQFVEAVVLFQLIY